MTNHPNREPGTWNCAANQQPCSEPVLVREPVPLCRTHGTETALALMPLLLGTANPGEPPRRTGTREPIETIRLRRTERAALANLDSNNGPITRRTVAAAIRAAGGTCSNQRATEIANHYRSVRSGG